MPSNARRVCVSILLCATELVVACARPKYPTSGSHTIVDEVATREGCHIRFQDSSRCLAWRWLTPPGDQSYGTMLVKLGHANAFDQTVIPEEQSLALTVFADMPSMHHGTIEEPKVERLDTGTYRISRIFLSMQGQWQIHLQQRDGARLVDEAIVPYEFNF